MLKLFLINIYYRGSNKSFQFKTADFVVAEKNSVIALEQVGAAIWRTYHILQWDLMEHCSSKTKNVGMANPEIRPGILLEKYQK